MRYHSLCTISLAIVASLLVGCNGISQLTVPATLARTQDVAFATVMPIPDVNTQVKLGLSTQFTEKLKLGRAFALSIENDGGAAVHFPYDWGIRSFVYSEADAKWVEVKDRTQYSPLSDNILDAKGHGPNWQAIVDVWPDLPEGQQPITVRVAVVGRLNPSASANSPIAAYTDVILPP